MNLFFVMDGKVITPATTGTILRGITRDSFITLLKDWGYTVEDRLLSIAEIADAYWRSTLQECFGAGTAAVVSHVSDITWRDRKLEPSRWMNSTAGRHTPEKLYQPTPYRPRPR